MKAKGLVSIVLLVFVAASIAYMVIHESAPPNPEGSVAAAAASAKSAPENTPATVPAHKVVAYYFHGTSRCKTCLTIERYAEETLKERFADALTHGELEFHSVNTEEQGNERFVSEYGLVTSSLVLVDVHDGSTREWANLEKVWELVGDEAAFKQYVFEQAREYLES